MSIWKYTKYYKDQIEKDFQLTKGEGNTPCPKCKKLSNALQLNSIYLKREDKNPTGSFKDRSLAYQLSYYFQQGKKKFAISSSGNAAISAINYAKLFPSTLHVFVSNNIPSEKNQRLKSTSCKHIHYSSRPKQDAIKFAKNNNAVLLRGSTDNTALVGFKSIAYDLTDQAPNADSIFIPCSSGTSTLGIYRGYKDLKSPIPQFHIAQTTKTHPIAKEFQNDLKKTNSSLASAIVDRVAHRKDSVVKLIIETGGSGWIIRDNEIVSAINALKKYCNLDVTNDAAVSLAALIKALKNNWEIKNPVLIISG